MEEPSVSVVIPTFNQADYLGQCIDQVLGEGYEALEIIVIDDGSSDETKQVLESYEGRIQTIHQENQGQAVARAKGLELASGELVCLLDSDDYWTSGFLSKLVPQFKRPSVGIAFANHCRVNGEGAVMDADSFRNERLWIQPFIDPNEESSWTVLDARETRRMYLDNFPPSSSGALFRKELVKYLPEKRLRRGDDYLFFMDLVLGSRCESAFTTETLWNLRTHGTNIRQQNRNVDLLLSSDILAKRLLLERHDKDLSAEEKRLLGEKMAVDYFDWGHALGSDRRVLEAAKKFLKAILSAPRSAASRQAFKGLAKLPLKALVSKNQS